MADAITWLQSLKVSRDAELPPALPPHAAPVPLSHVPACPVTPGGRDHGTRDHGTRDTLLCSQHTAYLFKALVTDWPILLSTMSPTLTHVVARVIF